MLFSVPIFAAGERTRDDMALLLERLHHKSDGSVDDDMSLLDLQTGKFSDINYYDISWSYWQPIKHLERICHFTEAYINPRHKYYNSPHLFHIISKGLEFWNDASPQCNNWWFNAILVPQQIGLILINLDREGHSEISNTLKAGLLDKMRCNITDLQGYTGANLADIAIHWIYRACITNNESDLKYAIGFVAKALNHSATDGITPDNCFFQHGKQLYIGAYGVRFLESMTKIAYLLRDTQYALSPDDLTNLFNFARNTCFRSIRGKNFSYNVIGRNISRKGGLDMSQRIIQVSQWLIELDPSNKTEYQSVIKRLLREVPASYMLETVHTHYFLSDYTLHTSPVYTFDVRLSSNHTKKCEMLNDENLLGYFLSEGSCCLQVTGNEYDNIFPVWNWTRIPGVTAPQIKSIPPVANNLYGGSDIAGGVSDSILGCTAFVYTDTLLHVDAKKSWFFFDKEIVCLGSGICSNSECEVETSINQCVDNEKKPVSYKLGDNKSNFYTIPFTTKIQNPSWILTNNVGYVFLEPLDVILEKKKQVGNWNQINHAYDKTLVEKNVLYIGVDHGIKPYDGTYSYRIIPKIESEDALEDYLSSSRLLILEKSQLIHAVYDSKADIMQVVFFGSGFLSHNDLESIADRPCALIIKGTKKQIRPTIHLASLLKSEKSGSARLSSLSLNKQIKMDFSKESQSGKTYKYNF